MLIVKKDILMRKKISMKGLEPLTYTLSKYHSNQLSYKLKIYK